MEELKRQHCRRRGSSEEGLHRDRAQTGGKRATELVRTGLTGAGVRCHDWDNALGTAGMQKEAVPSPLLLASFPYCLLLTETNWKQKENVLCRVLVPASQNRLWKARFGVRHFNFTTTQ